MTDATAEDVESPPKSSKMPMILGLVLALAAGGGGFYAVQSGLILGDESTKTTPEEIETVELAPVTFVELDPILVSLGGSAVGTYLRFRAQLEVNGNQKENVEAVLPRVIDVLNSYLRSVEPEELQDQRALINLRAQMLRRVQVVTGPGWVEDLLIMEFVLN